MGFKTLEEVEAFRAACAFKLEIYSILEESPAALRDFEFRDQLKDAASGVEMNVAEGFRRYLAGDFIKFLRVASGCLEEATRWVEDGVVRRYFKTERCERARDLSGQTGRLITGLIRSLLPFTKKRRRPGPRPPKNPRGGSTRPKRTGDDGAGAKD